MKRSTFGLIGAIALLAMLRPASGEVFLLTTGGRIEGELLNPDEKPRKSYSIKLPAGGQISLDVAQVKEVQTARPDESEYEKVRPRYPDTADGQWDLAEWCREHGLESQRKTHLKRVIELAPDHEAARRLLGYSKTNGKWMTHDEVMLQQGYRKYKGQWKLPQEIELLESKRKQEVAEIEWFQKIERWRHWLDRNDRRKQARENLQNIEDPVAVKALASKLQRETEQDVRLLYIETLGKIGTPEALMSLAVCSIEDTEEEVRLSCLDILVKVKNPQIIAYYVSRLKDKKNKMINRAGVALGRMKDPSTIRPLIESLVTTHQEKVGNGSSGGQSMSSSFPTGKTPGGFSGSFGGSNAPKIVRYQLQNQAVLDALVTITGQNFSFDQRAWAAWYVGQNKTKPIDARRG